MYSIAPTPQTQPPSPTLTPSTSLPLPPPDASSNAGAIAGGVIGGLVGVIIIILIIVVVAYLIWRKENLPSKCDYTAAIVIYMYIDSIFICNYEVSHLAVLGMIRIQYTETLYFMCICTTYLEPKRVKT